MWLHYVWVVEFLCLLLDRLDFVVSPVKSTQSHQISSLLTFTTLFFMSTIRPYWVIISNPTWTYQRNLLKTVAWIYLWLSVLIIRTSPWVIIPSPVAVSKLRLLIVGLTEVFLTKFLFMIPYLVCPRLDGVDRYSIMPILPQICCFAQIWQSGVWFILIQSTPPILPLWSLAYCSC